MILRILRGRAEMDELSELVELASADVRDWAASGGGMVSAQPAFRTSDAGLEFLMVSTWADAESVLARGGEVTLPRGRLGASGRLREGRAQHYELMMSASREDARPGEIVRLAMMDLVPRRSSAYYERLREVWDELVGDVGLVTLLVGRRVRSDAEQAVVVSVWDSEASLEAGTPGGYLGGDAIRSFHAGPPTFEHFTTLRLEPVEP